jgi:hypothetical protein
LLELMRTSVSFKRPEEVLTDHGWWVRSPVFGNGGLYYQRSFPVKPAPFSTRWRHQLLHLDPGGGTIRILLRSTAPFTGPMRIRSDKLYYALQELEGGYDNHYYNRRGLTSVLYSRSLANGPARRVEDGRSAGARGSRRLFKEPFRTFEVLPDGTILTAVDRGEEFGSEIRLHDPEGGPPETLLVTDLLVSDMVADAENLFVAARADWENTRIYRISIPGWNGRGEALSRLNPAKVRLEPLHETPYQEAELCLARDRLFYSATYGAKRTVYEYELGSSRVYRGVSSDFARSPAWDADSGTVYYIGLDIRGQDLYREKALRREFSVPGPQAPRQSEADGTAVGGRSAVPTAADLRIPEAEIRRGGYFDNVFSLRPRTLVPVFSLDPYTDPSALNFLAGAGIAGTSALGDIDYVLLGYYDSFNERPQADANLQTNILAPLKATFDLAAAGVPPEFRTDDFIKMSLTLELPLYWSLGKGLSSFSLGTTGTMEWEHGGEHSRILYPYSLFGFQTAAARSFLQIGVRAIHDVDDAVFAYLLVPSVATSVVFLGAELSLQASFLYELQGLDIGDFPWRAPGYADPLTGSWGGIVYSTATVPVLRFREGLWNPGLYVGDLYVEPFFALAFNQALSLQMSYGGTVRLELKAGARNNGFPLELYLGLGATTGGRPFYLFGVELAGYGQRYIPTGPAAAAANPRYTFRSACRQ